MLQDRV